MVVTLEVSMRNVLDESDVARIRTTWSQDPPSAANRMQHLKHLVVCTEQLIQDLCASVKGPWVDVRVQLEGHPDRGTWFLWLEHRISEGYFPVAIRTVTKEW